MSQILRGFRKLNRIELEVAEAGPRDGPLVVLLHGFPEPSYCWEYQMRYLADRGYRVLAPDQRGYNLSDKPSDIAAYQIDNLAADIAALIRSETGGRAFVAGHDWGGAVTWRLAQTQAALLKKFMVFNCPHPKVLAQSISKNPRQFLKSWYVFFFQIPWAPETVLSLGRFYALRSALEKTGAYTEAEIEQYCQAWGQPESLKSMINWYRAAARRRKQMLTEDTQTLIEVPGKIIWGARDAYLEMALGEKSAEFCTRCEFQTVSDASHWILREKPEDTARLMAQYFVD